MVTYRYLSRLVATILIGVLAAGCSSIVKKPDINGVKKVAIVSLYADQMIPWTGGTGRIDNFHGDAKDQVARGAYQAFAAEFKRLKWHVVPLEKVTGSDYYKKEFGPIQAKEDSNVLAKMGSAIGNLALTRYFTAKGMFPIEWQDPKNSRAGASFDLTNFKIEAKKDLNGQLADLAKNLGVDAVVLVYLDYCYTGATAVLGNGTAKITAGSWVKAVNPDKTVVVDMPAIGGRCDGDRGESDKTVAMVGGSIVLGKLLAANTLADAITEASRDTAKISVDKIEKAMKN